MKPRYNEGARDWQNMFGRTRLRISRFYSIYFITEPLYEYLHTSMSSRVFHYIAKRRFCSGEIVAYQTDIKNLGETELTKPPLNMIRIKTLIGT